MVPLLLLAVVALAIMVFNLKSRVNTLESQVDDLRLLKKDIDNELAHITRRLLALEGRASENTPPSAPVAEAPRATVAAEVAAVAARPERTGPVATARPIEPARAIEQPIIETPASHEPATAAGWEMKVGGSWLNKLGVLVFVIGLALLVRYYSGHLGPAGRDVIGFLVSFALLGLGVRLERRDRSRNYAYGLIAGGWAGIYFTTYAMHAIDAARVIDSDLAAIALLSVVAVAMIAHSLRFKSETVTVLAYVVGYATLMLSPLDTFAIVAAGVFAATSLVVAEKYGWSRVVLMTALSTYGTFLARREIFGRPEADLVTPLVSLGAYWLMFEAADIFALRRQRADGKPPFPLFLVNAAGLVGVALLEPALASPDVLSTFLAGAGAAYLASAMVRSRLLAGATIAQGVNGAEAAAFGSAQGAALASAGLIAWAILLRFQQPRATFALLVEFELLLLSALTMRDRVLRLAAHAGALVILAAALDATSGTDAFLLLDRLFYTWTPVVAAIALVWYLNAELLRARHGSAMERGYSYLASALFVIVLGREVDDAWVGLSLLAFAAALLETGVWRTREYRWQAWGVAALGLGLVLMAGIVGSQTGTKHQAVLALSLASAMGWLTAARARWQWASRLSSLEAGGLALGSCAIGLTCLATLEWRVAPVMWIGVAWAATALALIVIARLQGLRPLAWLADPLLFAAGARMLPILFDQPGAIDHVVTADAGVIAAFYIASVVIAPSRKDSPDAGGESDDVVRVLTSLAGSFLLMMLIVHDVRPSLVTLAWGLQGAALLAFGFPLRERTLRLSGLATLFICIARLFIVDLSSLDPLARIVSYLMLGAVMLAVSWIYTRFREQIGKYL
jgi:uncharacterized membrane protein